MIEFDDFVLVLAKPELYGDCRGFAGVGMPHHRIDNSRRQGVLGWLARCLFCETPDTVKFARAYCGRESPKALLAGSASFRSANVRAN
ncbi:MAG: hypothetical protein VCD50_05035 [Alphaproteobacteria bacterium]|jgi:hypothetical protein